MNPTLKYPTKPGVDHPVPPPWTRHVSEVPYKTTLVTHMYKTYTKKVREGPPNKTVSASLYKFPTNKYVGKSSLNSLRKEVGGNRGTYLVGKVEDNTPTVDPPLQPSNSVPNETTYYLTVTVIVNSTKETTKYPTVEP